MPAKWQQWYPHYIDGWNGSAAVQGFTDAAYRAYHNLLMAQFESEDGMLDPDRLAKSSRMGVRWNQPREGMPTISEEVMEEFESANGRVYNPRLRQEWLKAKEVFEKKRGPELTPEKLSELRSGAGKQGAKARWQKDGKTIATCHENMAKSWQNDGYTGTVTETETSTEKQEPTPRKSAAVIPEWIPRDSWDGFVEMRKKIRAPLTTRAVTETIRDLEKLAKAGHDPGAVLDQSTQRSWRGVFEIKGGEHAGNQGNRFGTKTDRNREAARRAYNEIIAESANGTRGGAANDSEPRGPEAIHQAPVVLPPERRENDNQSDQPRAPR